MQNIVFVIVHVPGEIIRIYHKCEGGIEKSVDRVIDFITMFLFDLILYVPSTIFQLNRDGSPWVRLVLS